MTTFQDKFKLLLEDDKRLNSSRPSVYELFRTDNGLFKRVYHSGTVSYSKDKEGAILHNLDGPAVTRPSGSVATRGYYIDGNCVSKEEWDKERLVYGIKNKKDKSDVLDILDI